MRTALPIASFDCARTCPAHKTHWCRFNALFRLVGIPRVHSHTVKIKVSYTDPDALRDAVTALGWQWLGCKTHQLFSGQTATGHGFQIPSWRYPCVLQSGGELAYDDYNGAWGNVADLEALKTAYLSTNVETAANLLGWQTERTPQGITVYHPEGGTITVDRQGVCETSGFIGRSCHEAREALGLKPDGAPTNKTEIDHLPAVIHQTN